MVYRRLAADFPIPTLFKPSRSPLRATLWQWGSQGVPAIREILREQWLLTLDDEQLGLRGVLRRAVLQLAEVLHSEDAGVLLSDLLAGLRGRDAGLRGVDRTLTEKARLLRILLQPPLQAGVDGLLDSTLGVTV